jgi:hypothetical protein
MANERRRIMRDSQGRPRLDFRVPTQGQPADVAEVWRRYDTSADLAARLQGEIKDAAEGIKPAQRLDAEELAEKLRKNPDAPITRKHEDALRAKLADLETRRKAALINADVDGNTLADVVAQHRAAWHADLETAAAQAGARVKALVAELDVAIKEYGVAQSGATWLSRFDAGQAKGGRLMGFSGRGVDPVIEARAGSNPVSAILPLVAASVDPPKPPPTYVPISGREASFDAA